MMIRYLFGELSPNDRSTLEERYFADDELFDELVCIENELVDSYVHGTLSRGERRRFETYLAVTPERREKVRFAKCLANEMDGAINALAPSADRPKFTVFDAVFAFIRSRGLLLAVSVAAFIAAGLAVWVLKRGPRREPTPDQARVHPTDDKETHVWPLADSLPRPSSPPTTVHSQTPEVLPSPQSQTASLALKHTLNRGMGEDTLLLITPQLSKISVRITLERDPYAFYTVELETVEGDRVWQGQHVKSHLSPDGIILSIALQPKLLRTGDYIVRVLGTVNRNQEGEVEAYSFRVLNRLQ
jgi:hypothetical protein